jgi:PilZ domain
MSIEERRRSPRLAVDVPVTIHVAGQPRKAVLKDICRDAALVELDRWEALGTEVILEMDLPGSSGPLRVTGEVIRLAPGEQAGHGMAILFSASTAEVETGIDAFIARQGEA